MSQNNPELAYETIKIFKKTYRLPVMGGESFTALQGNIQQRQEIIKTGQRQERVIFWIKQPKEISFEQRFSELNFLVKNYNQLIYLLKSHREAYQTFFIDLTEELKEVVNLNLKREQLYLEIATYYSQKNDPNFHLTAIFKSIHQRVYNY